MQGHHETRAKPAGNAALLAVLVLVLILLAMTAKSLLVSVPPVRERSAAGQFDTTRAMARLERIIGDERPHPSDTEANDAVRARLIAELASIGIQPIVRDQMVCRSFAKARTVSCARVRNVIGTIGPDGGKALLLSAHYDGTSAGPAAADDGIGVATLLEVAAQMRQRPLRRPVMFLFNDGEELGLLGAQAFLADPLRRQVDAVLNFEARGVTGPVTMFETSRPNAAAIKVFADAVERPFASSMTTDVYRLMPNDTDVSVYKDRGWFALNFAMAGNETRYHSPTDNLAGLDRRSLQHMGDQALATATRLSDGTPQATGNRIFIDVLGRFLVHMPLAVGLILFGLTLLGSAGLTLRRGRVLRSVTSALLALMAAGVAAWLASSAMAALRPGTYWRGNPEITLLAVYAAAMLGLLLSLRTIGSVARVDQLRAGYWFTFLLIGAGLATVAPGAIIYFLLPPLLVLAGAAAQGLWKHAGRVGALLAVIVLYLTWGEMLALLEQLFSPGPQWIVAPIGALMMLPALIEAHPLLVRTRRSIVLGGAALLALVAWIAVAAAPAYSHDRKQMFIVEHVTDVKAGKAYWAVLNDGAPIPEGFGGMALWEKVKLPHSQRERWAAPAPSANVVPPRLELISQSRQEGSRTIRLRLRTNGAAAVSLRASADARILAGGVGTSTQPLSAPTGSYSINCSGRSCEGAEMTLRIGGKEPVMVTLVGVRPGLPPQGKALLSGRPAFAQPQYGTDQTITVGRLRI
jgi:hypothetical protein